VAFALLLVMFASYARAAEPAATRFDVRSFGAVGDGKTKDTAAFQRALDACADAKSGGEVLVPAGSYLIGSIVINSNTTLRLEEGANLIGSPDKEDYPVMTIRWEGVWRDGHRALIHAAKAKHIAIVGKGTIIGNFPLGHLRNPRGPCIFEPIECEDVRLEGFSVEYERMWAIHPTYCRNVTAAGLKIRSTLDNGDGIDVDSSEHVVIDHCDIDTGDDAIALKSGRGAEGARIGRPTQDVVVTDCTLGSRFAGLAIGSEMSGGVRKVRVERCTFTRGSNSIFIKSRTGRGGFIEDVQCRDLEARAGAFLRIDLTSRGITGADPLPGLEGIPQVRQLSFSNVKSTAPVLVDAVRIAPEKPLRGLVLENVSATCRRGIVLANITDAQVRDIRAACTNGPLLTIANVTGTGLEGARKISVEVATRSATEPTTRP
jgi:polygalacturonase